MGAQAKRCYYVCWSGAREQLGAETALADLLEQARRGIVFVDEVDKIRAFVGGRPNTAGIRAQEALLDRYRK